MFLFWHSKQFMYTTCSELVVFMYWTGKSMNNLLSYCGLVVAWISASEKDLPVLTILLQTSLPKPRRGIFNFVPSSKKYFEKKKFNVQDQTWWYRLQTNFFKIIISNSGLEFFNLFSGFKFNRKYFLKKFTRFLSFIRYNQKGGNFLYAFLNFQHTPCLKWF